MLRPPLEGTPKTEISIVWLFQLSVSPPQPNRNLGECHKLHHRGPGRSPSQKWVLVHLELERTHLMAIYFVFLERIFIHIFMTGNQCDILHKNFQEDQLNSRFPGGLLNSSRFQGFPRVVVTLLYFQKHIIFVVYVVIIARVWNN